MILADTSVWIDHFRSRDALLMDALDRGDILIHPFVIGEISMGNLADRQRQLPLLSKLPIAIPARPSEILRLIEARHLYGRGIGYVDVHLLASTLLTQDTTLWTRDRRLRSTAEWLGIAAKLTH